ncbi:hypothetical protein E4U59_007886 [Claviceps monticola]|nr:hypothetical protein E4U59_007886 [Claviceps monticola]
MDERFSESALKNRLQGGGADFQSLDLPKLGHPLIYTKELTGEWGPVAAMTQLSHVSSAVAPSREILRNLGDLKFDPMIKQEGYSPSFSLIFVGDGQDVCAWDSGGRIEGCLVMLRLCIFGGDGGGGGGL